MKLAIFIQGWSLPSSRFRILQYLSKFDEAGIEYDIFCPVTGRSGFSYQWLPGPLYHIFRHLTQLLFYYPHRMYQILFSSLGAYDAVFIQKSLSDWPNTCFLEKMISKMNRNVIYDIDDAEFTRMDQSRSRRDTIREIVSRSQLFLPGNSYLAEQLKVEGCYSLILPTTVDENNFVPRDKGKVNEKICVGWTGTAANFRYLFDLIPVFESLHHRDDVEFLIISNRDHIDELAHIRHMKFSLWSDKSEVEDLQRFDIGLMPLHDDEWTRGKCAFKLIQYMAIGIPSVISPVGANNDVLINGETGYFAEDENGWIRYLERLLDDKNERYTLGANARARFVNSYSLASNMTALKNALNKLCA